jgi:hypothetical protein
MKAGISVSLLEVMWSEVSWLHFSKAGGMTFIEF